MTEYNIFQYKIDNRFKQGIIPSSFKYIAEAEDYETAKEKAKELKQDGYAIGIEEITRYE